VLIIRVRLLKSISVVTNRPSVNRDGKFYTIEAAGSKIAGNKGYKYE